MRFFNTAGPVRSVDHYCIPPLKRLDLAEMLRLIEQKKYFVLHAPRQTGKTSCLLALMDYLNQEGNYCCLYVNVEMGQAAREDVREGIHAILSRMASMERAYLNDRFLTGIWKEVLEESGPYDALNEALTRWAQASPKPLILLIDEIDALVGDTLISVLRQLRAGYSERPVRFPQSIILCGVRDVRDYRIHSDRDKTIITGGSAFNIKAESLRLGNFEQAEVAALYAQHTEETGQQFTPRAMDMIWDLTQGQPWLVNALGYEVCFKMNPSEDWSSPITDEIVTEAKERIILRREVHLDQLADKLSEVRVQQVIGPILQGEDLNQSVRQDDIQYVVDLGLVDRTETGLKIANSIYREIIPRELSFIFQLNFESSFQPSWYITSDGGLNMDKLLSAFQDFFREHSEHWVERFDYKEAGPQLLLQAFLQRIVNSGGRIEREYGLGRMRTDLLVIWSYQGSVQKIVIELKILYRSLEETIAIGLKQTWEYMDRCGAEEGHLVIFDRRADKSWEEKVFQRAENFQDKKIIVWGM